MDNYDWTTPVTGADSHLEYRWREYHHEGKSLGYFGELVDSLTGEAAKDLPTPLKTKLLARAAHKRREEVLPTLPEPRAQAVLELFRRSVEGEYLGQGTNNELLYVQDIAAIFGEDLGVTLAVVDELVAAGKLGLNGMILTTNEAYEETFELYRKTNGHLRLTASDFGYWACSACGASGDEWDDPADTPCESKEETDE